MTADFGLIMFSIEQAKKGGDIISVEMSERTLIDLTLAKDLDIFLKDKGFKEIRPTIIEQETIEFILGSHIIIDHGRKGIKIKTEKETVVTFE